MKENVIHMDGEVKIPKKKGGKRTGAGRKTRAEKLSNYDRAIKMLDDSIEMTLQTLIDGLGAKDPVLRIKCAEILLKKTLPDKKRSEITGKDGGAIAITPADVRAAITEVEGMVLENREKSLIEENE